MYRWSGLLIVGLPTLVAGLALFTVGVATLLPGLADAHHSIAAVYHSRRETTIEGVIAEFHFVRPHPFLILSVNGEAGEQQYWRLELDNRFELARIGIAEETFRPGDHIVATGHPGREQAETLYVRRLDRPADGLRYEQIGRSPRISPQTTVAPR